MVVDNPKARWHAFLDKVGKPKKINPALTDIRQARHVFSLSAEYRYIDTQRCPECGGSYRIISDQRHENSGGEPLDIFVCECNGCGAPRRFYFNVVAVFGRRKGGTER
ncbi:MAG: hypothetical protein GF399_03015 [Candidatus Coatesbacteria bacterium]|nr:hypothetical protein [Candidatus Coatesbacteria bacterium]